MTKICYYAASQDASLLFQGLFFYVYIKAQPQNPEGPQPHQLKTPSRKS